MAKPRKPNAPKPPVPSDSHAAIEMVAYDVSVNVVFFGGADFDPPPPLGTVGRSRYVKLKTLEEAQGFLMRKWIEHAGRVRGWK